MALGPRQPCPPRRCRPGLGARTHRLRVLVQSSRRPSGLRKTIADGNSLAHRTTWLRSDFRSNACVTRRMSAAFDGAGSSPALPSAPLQARPRGSNAQVTRSRAITLQYPQALRRAVLPRASTAHLRGVGASSAHGLAPSHGSGDDLQRIHRCAALRAGWAVLPVRGSCPGWTRAPARLASEVGGPSGLRKTIADGNSLAHRTTWLRSDLPGR